MEPVSTLITLLLIIGAVSAHPNSNICKKEGRFADPEDCTKYYLCRLNNDGVFEHEHGDCKGYPFHPKKQACVEHSLMPTCKSRNPRHYSEEWAKSVERPEYECTEDGFFCLDCENVILCVNGTAFHERQCSSGDVCQKPESFMSYTCYNAKESTEGCSCEEANTYIQDPYNEQKFSYCLTATAAPIFKQCEGEMVFNVTAESCINSNGAPECQKAGRFPHPSDCTLYYNCIPVLGGRYEQIFHNCSEDLMFNEQSKECSDPCTWPNPNFECTKDGRFPDPKSCNNYYVCTEYPKGSGEIVKVHQKCPIHYQWDQTALGGLGKCDDPKKIVTPCLEAQEGRCEIPARCSAESGTAVESSSPSESSASQGQESTPNEPEAPVDGSTATEGESTSSTNEDDTTAEGGSLPSIRRRFGFKPKEAATLANIASNLLANSKP